MIRKTIALGLLFALSLAVGEAAAGQPIGVVVNSDLSCIQLVNPVTRQLSPCRLQGDLGYSGGLLDAVITPDGKTAIVSNFYAATLYFVDISKGFKTPPRLLGSVGLSFYAEDIALSPDGKYVVVTDGGFSSYLAVVDVAKRVLVSELDAGETVQAQAVDITPDNTVIVADYWYGMVHTFRLLSYGVLKYSGSYEPAPSYPWPVNVCSSPDGKTVIVPASWTEWVLSFYKQGRKLTRKPPVALPHMNGQSCVFNKDGTKAYYLTDNGAETGTQVHVLNVTAPGKVAYSGTSIKTQQVGPTGQLYGVDTLAIDPAGNYLYVTNPTDSSDGGDWITVIDLTKNRVVGRLRTAGYPAGIAFGTIQ